MMNTYGVTIGIAYEMKEGAENMGLKVTETGGEGGGGGGGGRGVGRGRGGGRVGGGGFWSMRSTCTAECSMRAHAQSGI